MDPKQLYFILIFPPWKNNEPSSSNSSSEPEDILFPFVLLQPSFQMIHQVTNYTREELLLRERKRQATWGISSYELDTTSGRLIFPACGSLFTCIDDGKNEPYFPNELKTAITGTRLNNQMCPHNPDLVSFVRNNDLWIQHCFSGVEIQLTFTHRGFDNLSQDPLSAGVPSYIIQEEFNRYSGHWWQPKSNSDGTSLAIHSCRTICVDYESIIIFEVGDSKYVYRILYEEVDDSEVDVLQFSFPSETGSIESFRFPRTGTPNSKSTLKLAQFNCNAVGEITDVSLYTLEESIESLHPWVEYIVRVGWTPEGKYVWAVLLNRLQNFLNVVLFPVSAFTCTDNSSDMTCKHASLTELCEVIYEEKTDVWLNIHDILHFFPIKDDKITFIWASEKSGFRHLYLITSKLASSLSKSSNHKNSIAAQLDSDQSKPNILESVALTSGQWEVLPDNIWVDEDKKLVYFVGLRDSPLEKHLYVVSLEKPEYTIRLTEYGFTHNVNVDLEFNLFVTIRSNTKSKPKCVVYSIVQTDASSTSEVKGDPPDITSQVQPEIFSYDISSGHTMYGFLFRPPNMTLGIKYPTVLIIYGGPEVQLISNNYKGLRVLRHLMLALEGYVVVSIDSRGSRHRGVEFESHIKNRLGTVELNDQIEVLELLAADMDFIDLNRIAIHGWSYGGYLSLMGLAQRPDFFKIAIAGAPVTSWELYDTGYTERYLGLPSSNSQGYKTGSVLSYIEKFPDDQLLSKFSATTLELMKRRNGLIIRNSEDLLERRDLNKTIHKRQRTETRACNQTIVKITIREGKRYKTAKKRLAIGRIMPLTSAERQRKRRERLQVVGQYKDYRKNQNEMSKKCRRIKAMKEKTLPKSIYDMLVKDRKEKIYKRVAKFRAKNLSQTSANVIEPFKTASALGKATARAKRALQNALPSSPKRKAAVMKKLYTTIPDITLSTSEQLQEHKNGIPADIVANVKNFYERDDISRQAPGRRNVINVRGADGIKIQFQTRHLTSSILETHALFCEEFPDTRIGKSKFAELRPRHVLLSSKLPHNVCLCRHHENFIIAINALHKANLSVPLYSHDLPQLFLCNLPTHDCWFNNCNACNNGKGFLKAYPIEETTEVLWSVWKNAEDGRLSKIVEEEDASNVYNTERQKAAAASGQDEHSLIQIDFSENYTCISQDEIQSAHWKQAQISLFTAALWYLGSLHSLVLVSDNITHSKDTVIPYIDRLLEELPKTVRKVSLWSDGPASQFKNRYILASLKPLQDKYNITIRWNFFATSHGKGPVDGIGGSVKRFVWNGVRSRKFVVSNAEGFKLAARTSQVKVVAVTPNELNERYQKLNLDKIFRDAILVKGIANMHFMAVNQDQPVYFHLTKDALAVNDKAFPTVSIRKGKEHGTDIRVGDWCAVEYERFSYPGEVKQIEGSDYKVSVMIPAGKNWKWPTCPDEIFYRKEKILTRLQPPCIVNNRGHFSFKDFKSSI
ncbi:Dipeptidyl peptidase 8 [Nymphon striatum]|nr:Dipeptidyl peptidase 8 [Nymphon striatum]